MKNSSITKKSASTYMLKARIQQHRTEEGQFTFTIDLPLQCGRCGCRFTSRVQVGVNNPVISCPFCYSRNYLILQWHLEKGVLTEGDVARVIIHT